MGQRGYMGWQGPGVVGERLPTPLEVSGITWGGGRGVVGGERRVLYYSR